MSPKVVALAVAALLLTAVALPARAETSAPLDLGLHVSWFEQGHGPPMVLIHGFGDSKETWRGVAEPLSKYFRVYAFDTLGFGASTSPLGVHTIDAYVGQLEAFIERRKIREPIFVGHSMGAQIAVAYLAANRHFPETTKYRECRGLVLLAPSGVPGMTPAFGAAMGAVRQKAELVNGALDEPAAWEVVRRVLEEVMVHDELVTDDLVATYLKPFQSPAGRETLSDVIRLFRYDLVAGLEDVLGGWQPGYQMNVGYLPRLHVIRGKEDPWIAPAGVEAIVAVAEKKRYAKPRFKAFRVDEIADAGHLPHRDAPSAVATAIIEFFTMK